MAEASIPVDLFNPGQVFACLGFLEAAEILLGDAEGGFDWSEQGESCFQLSAASSIDPIQMVLRFLADAELLVIAPTGVDGPWPKIVERTKVFPAPLRSLRASDGKGFSASALPVELRTDKSSISISHWLEGDNRIPLKLFAGKQVGSQLAANMLYGNEKKKSALGFKSIYQVFEENGFKDPFNIVGPVFGRFGFDARGGWDSIKAGTSIDAQDAYVEVSPLIELLSSIGLENTRPAVLSTYQIRYTVWRPRLPPILCRAAFCRPSEFIKNRDLRSFRVHLGEDKYYKKIFMAEEEENQS